MADQAKSGESMHPNIPICWSTDQEASEEERIKDKSIRREEHINKGSSETDRLNLKAILVRKVIRKTSGKSGTKAIAYSPVRMKQTIDIM